MNIPVNSDVFDITSRLKQIDPSYFVVFNTNKQKYELHSNEQLFTTYCLTIPFDSLDSRTVELANKTRRQNQQALLKEMEQENQKYERSQRRLYGC